MGLLTRAAKYRYDRYVGLRLSTEVFQAIQEKALKEGVSLSDVIRNILHHEFIKETSK